MTAPPKESPPGSRAWRELLVILLIAAIAFWIASWLDAFEWLVDVVHHYEHYELDEVVILLAILAFALGAFAVRRWIETSKEYAKRLEAERVKVAMEAAGTVSHEFNQPLQVIMGTGELALAEAPEGSKLRRYLEDILSSAKRIAELIAKFNKLTTYRTKPYYKDQDILDLE